MVRQFGFTILFSFLFLSLSYPQTSGSDQLNDFSFEIIPVTIIESGDGFQMDQEIPIENFMQEDSSLVFHEGDFFTFKIRNRTDRRLYYLLFDIIHQESYFSMLNDPDEDFSIKPGDSVVCNSLFYFSEPFGCEMFALYYSEDPIINNSEHIGKYNIDILGKLFQTIPLKNRILSNEDFGVDTLYFGLETICVTVSEEDNNNRCAKNPEPFSTADSGFTGEEEEKNIEHSIKDQLFSQSLVSHFLMSSLIESHTSIMVARSNITSSEGYVYEGLLKYFMGEIYSSGIKSIPDHHKSIMYYYNNDTLNYALLSNKGIIGSGKTMLCTNQVNELIYTIQNSIYKQQNKKRTAKKKRGTVVWENSIQASEIDYDSAISILSHQLFPESLCSKIANTSHIQIIPEFNLGTLPFCLLKPFPSDIYLIDSVSLSVISNLFDLASFSHLPWEYGFSTPLLVGNPDYPESEEWDFPQLPNAEKEIIEIGDLLNGSPIIGSRASLSRVIQQSADADLLYFATHGISQSEEALQNSFLVFTASDYDDGLWRAIDIQKQELKAKLAVLSACQTGLGQTHIGGIIGLARAFQEAGVPRVVMSLWSVGDESTYALMNLFMKYLEVHPPAKALQLAMIEYKKHDPNPYNWGSFTLFGYPY